jgi:curli production assembly/transport component CsgG
MIFKSKYLILAICALTSSLNSILAQEFSLNSNLEQEKTLSENEKLWNRLVFFDYRGTNAIDVALGGSKTNGDLPDSEFAFYYKIGYKRYIKDHLNINITYHNYNVVFGDFYDERFMSFDLNFEYFVSPYTKFSPFVQAGFGYNIRNHSTQTSFKAQWALGLEYILIEGVGLKLFGEYNSNFTDDLEDLSMGETNDIGIRLGFGINFYFGGKKKRAELLSRVKTVIKSNLLK